MRSAATQAGTGRICLEPNSRRAKQRLERSLRKAIQLGRTLRSRRARRTLDDTLRLELLAAAEAVRDDLRSLKQALRCPDAPA